MVFLEPDFSKLGTMGTNDVGNQWDLAGSNGASGHWPVLVIQRRPMRKLALELSVEGEQGGEKGNLR